MKTYLPMRFLDFGSRNPKRQSYSFIIYIIVAGLFFSNSNPVLAQTPTLHSLTILGGQGTQGDIDQYTEASRDGGVTWQPAYLTGWHPWGFYSGTNSWINFDPSPFVGLNSTTDYRIRFTIPEEYTDPTMVFSIKADNFAIMSFNGTALSSFFGAYSSPVSAATLNSLIHSGLNEINIRLVDYGGWVGLNYRIDLTMVSIEDFGIIGSKFVNSDPVANAGVDQTVNCAPSGGSLITLNGGASTDEDNDELSYTWTWVNGTLNGVSPSVMVPNGSYTFNLSVDDGNGGVTVDDVLITVNVDNEAPVFQPFAEITRDNDPGICGAVVDLGQADVSDNCGLASVTNDAPEVFPVGLTDVTWTAVDNNGNIATAIQTVSIEDNEAPVLQVANQFVTLWPPNHEYVNISLDALGLSLSDNCSADLADVYIKSVSSDEPEDVKGGGDGNTKDDIVINGGCTSVNLRAEREGKGNGRVYTITLSVSDAAGNETTAQFFVQVPHDKKDTAVNDGANNGYTVSSVCGGKSGKLQGIYANDISSELELKAYPNPFSHNAEIVFNLNEETFVQLNIYDITGRVLTTLNNGTLQEGVHRYNWNGQDSHGNPVSNGLYFVILKTNNEISRSSLILER